MLWSSLILAATLAEPRSFWMGFSPWPWDLTVEAVTWTKTNVRKYGDAIEQHFEEGVPWPEMLSGDPLHPALEDEINFRINFMEGKKRIVSINALNIFRNGLAPYRGEQANMPLPPPWDSYRLNSPQVKQAYLAWCNLIITRMEPDVLIIGVEVNELLKNDEAMWADYKELHRATYSALKRTHPNLPICFSMTVIPFFDGISSADPQVQKRELREMLRSTDIMCWSNHPFMSAWTTESVPDTLFDTLAPLAQGKPMGISESSFPAQEWSMLINGTTVWFRGSHDKQASFLKNEIAAADKYKMKFLCWFTIRDYDQLWERFGRNELMLVWRDTGLFDEEGNQRPGMRIWSSVLARPHQ